MKVEVAAVTYSGEREILKEEVRVFPDDRYWSFTDLCFRLKVTVKSPSFLPLRKSQKHL
jgi:hypothetical protein